MSEVHSYGWITVSLVYRQRHNTACLNSLTFLVLACSHTSHNTLSYSYALIANFFHSVASSIGGYKHTPGVGNESSERRTKAALYAMCETEVAVDCDADDSDFI